MKVINNLSRDKDLLANRTAENTIRTKSNTKNLKALYPPNDSGNRLYNYGYYIKNKLNKKRQKEEEKMRKQMTPKILNLIIYQITIQRYLFLNLMNYHQIYY